MLNLKELEESLDTALASETDESVIAWFQERDKEKIKQYIGVNGYLSSLACVHDKTSKSEMPTNPQIDTDVPSLNNFALAA